MKRNRHPRLISAALVTLIILSTTLACNLPSGASPTPFVFPTPDLTLTSIYSVLITPTPIVVNTATPVQLTSQPTAAESPTMPPIMGTFLPATPLVTDTAPAPTPTTAPPNPTSGPQLRTAGTVEAAYLNTPPTIDGNLGEWSLPWNNANHVTFGADRWDNPEDLSSRFMIGWDANNLYIAVQVTDEDYVQNAQGENLFMGDSLEILFDANLHGDFNSDNLNDDDFQLGISPGYTEPGERTEAYLWFPRDRAGSRSEVRTAAVRLDEGYQVETAIPWSVFDTIPQENRSYGFVFSVSDNDRTGQVDQQTMVSNIRVRRLSDPTTWGNLTLTRP
jgi:hypothetical protein